MSRHLIPAGDGQAHVGLVGWDRGGATFYAQLWPVGADVDFDPPAVELGDESARIADADELANLLRSRLGFDLAPRVQTQLTVDKALGR